MVSNRNIDAKNWGNKNPEKHIEMKNNNVRDYEFPQ